MFSTGDGTSILNIAVSPEKVKSIDNLSYDCDDLNDKFFDSFKNISNCLYITNVIEYIAEFISRKLVKGINCEICASALTAKTPSLESLLKKK